MVMQKYFGIALLLSLVVLVPVQAAPTPDTQQQEELTWYDVEIIIFRHHDLFGASKENWPLDPGEPDFVNATKLLPSLPRRLSSAQTARLRKPLAFTRLRSDELRMNDQLDRLLKSKGYEPLMHMGWRQPGYDREQAKAVHISGGIPMARESDQGDQSQMLELIYYDNKLEGPPPPIINGTITLVRSRYLHFETDLVYHNTLPEQKGDIHLPTRYFRMQTSRRMRSTEINYIDHPMFGILVLITPYEDPEATPQESQPTP